MKDLQKNVRGRSFVGRLIVLTAISMSLSSCFFHIGKREAPVTPAYNAPEGYSLVWHDEFDNGTELNPEDWTHEVQRSGWVNHELQNYVDHKSPEGNPVTEIKDGTLRIHCFMENGKIYSGRVYAHVSEGWQYGYIEASIKLPAGKGTWPAFWMMPVGNDWRTNPWPM